jgi:hypothetical protein
VTAAARDRSAAALPTAACASSLPPKFSFTGQGGTVEARQLDVGPPHGTTTSGKAAAVIGHACSQAAPDARAHCKRINPARSYIGANRSAARHFVALQHCIPPVTVVRSRLNSPWPAFAPPWAIHYRQATTFEAGASSRPCVS